MRDSIEKIGKSLLQHGEYNDRIYLMKLHRADYPDILGKLNILAREKGYGKIFAKVPAWSSPRFKAEGYIQEGLIPDFYSNPKEDAFFMSKFMNSDRVHFLPEEPLAAFAEVLTKYSRNKKIPSLKKKYKLKFLNYQDVERITGIYREVFASYPFPIHDPAYIEQVMLQNGEFYGIFHKKELVAVSSAEVDRKQGNAEMTDFATLPDYRGEKLSVILLAHMEKQMKLSGVNTLYTIARLNSIPMNLSFLRMGYKYGGTLINNTNISGKIESMNVLYKHL